MAGPGGTASPLTGSVGTFDGRNDERGLQRQYIYFSRKVYLSQPRSLVLGDRSLLLRFHSRNPDGCHRCLAPDIATYILLFGLLSPPATRKKHICCPNLKKKLIYFLCYKSNIYGYKNGISTTATQKAPYSLGA